VLACDGRRWDAGGDGEVARRPQASTASKTFRGGTTSTFVPGECVGSGRRKKKDLLEVCSFSAYAFVGST
jgi:hypothetical protein